MTDMMTVLAHRNNDKSLTDALQQSLTGCQHCTGSTANWTALAAKATCTTHDDCDWWRVDENNSTIVSRTTCFHQGQCDWKVEYDYESHYWRQAQLYAQVRIMLSTETVCAISLSMYCVCVVLVMSSTQRERESVLSLSLCTVCVCMC